MINLNEREHLFQEVARFFILERNHAEISQMLEGFHPELLSLIRRFPEEGMKELIYTPKHIKAVDIINNWQYEFSPSTSPLRKSESNIAFQWEQLLDELEAGQSRNVTYYPVVEGKTGDAESKIVTITIEDVLQFLTGSRFIPALGFSKKGTVKFLPTTGKTSGSSATTSTCFLWLNIPVSENYYQKTATSFCEDIVQSPGFDRL